MTLLGTLLKNRRGRGIHSAWNRPNLQGPELLIVTSEDSDLRKPADGVPSDLRSLVMPGLRKVLNPDSVAACRPLPLPSWRACRSRETCAV